MSRDGSTAVYRRRWRWAVLLAGVAGPPALLALMLKVNDAELTAGVGGFFAGLSVVGAVTAGWWFLAPAVVVSDEVLVLVGWRKAEVVRSAEIALCRSDESGLVVQRVDGSMSRSSVLMTPHFWRMVGRRSWADRQADSITRRYSARRRTA